MADGTADIPPAYSTGDDWWTAVHLLTGYQPPNRGIVFKDLMGNNQIPLMKLEISDSSVSPDLAELDAINQMSWRTANSGWRIRNTDFVVPFFNGPTGVGSTVKMRNARITLLGTDSDHSVPDGGVDMGATFTENGSHLMGGDFQGWDSRPLSRYSFGGGMALEALLNPPYSTWRFAWNDIHVEDNAAVDLTGFDRAADAFDRAAAFFHVSRATIQGWEDLLGAEDASWQGQAAGVFWDIIHQLGVTYQNYTDTLPVAGGFSAAGNDLRNAKQGIYNALSNLHSTWHSWALWTGNPLRWLHDILLEVTDDIWDNNLVKVRAVPEYHGGYNSGGSTTWSNQVASDGFRVNALNKNGGNYGDLNDLNTWKNIGEEAVKRWQQSVVDQLGTAGAKALKDVHNAWVGLNKSLQKLTTQSVSLQSDYQSDRAAAEQRKADEAAAAAAQHQKEEQEKADRQRAEDLAHQREMEAKAEKERAEDLAHQREQEAKAEKERQEQEQHQREQEAKADRERQEQEQHQREQEAKAEKERQEQEQHQREQEDQAKQQYQQQQQEQKEEQARQEQHQREQEAKAEQQYQQQMATQMAMQQQQEKKQDEQEKKQEQLQREQEAKQEQLQREQEAKAKQQYDQQRQDQQEQQKKQEQLQKEQEEKAQQQYAQQQKTQADYQQKQEEQAKQQFAQQKQQYRLPDGGGGADDQEQALQHQQQIEHQLQQQQDQFQNQLENAFHGQIGSQTHVNPDGTVTTDFSDGSSTTIDPHTGLETTTLPDGSVSTEHLSHHQTLTNPDGSTTTVNDDGTLTTHYPDGSVTTVNPRTGMATTHEPDGQTITTPLGGGATLPHLPSAGAGAGSLYEPELHDLPFDGSLGSAAPMATEAAVPGSAVSQSGGVLPLGTRLDGTTTGGMPPAGSPMMGGMGGMPMGGMGGGEKNGSGERVRQVYDDEDIVTSGGGPLGRRSRRGTSYEEESAAGRRTPTAAGYDPYGAGDERERTQSGDREREAWVPEEEDVWGTDEGGSPAVIG
jgi:hypothetical protein